MRKHHLQLAALFLLLNAAAACSGEQGGFLPNIVADGPPVHVDSLLSTDEEIERFRVAIGAPVDSLSGGAASPEVLIEQFLAALSNGDLARLDGLAVTAEEFAYLYYPESRFSRPPYQMSPALLWLQMEHASSTGIERSIERFGQRELHLEGWTCAGEPEIVGKASLWSGCSVKIGQGGEGAVELPLFASILEREGMFKFFSYGNRL